MMLDAALLFKIKSNVYQRLRVLYVLLQSLKSHKSDTFIIEYHSHGFILMRGHKNSDRLGGRRTTKNWGDNKWWKL